MCFPLVTLPKGLAPKGQESLTQGLPWDSRDKRFALKGLEMRPFISRFGPGWDTFNTSRRHDRR
jgi:hypothetical protein